MSRFKVLLEKGIKLFLFGGRERVDLAALWVGIGLEFHCMIPGSGLRQVVEGLFGEDRMELA